MTKTALFVALAFTVGTAVGAVQKTPVSQASESVSLGSVELRLGMPRKDALAALSAVYQVNPSGQGFIVWTKNGPPYSMLGGVDFDSLGFLNGISRNWTPEDVLAGGATVDALFRALVQITKPTGAEIMQRSPELTSIRGGLVTLLLTEASSPGGTGKTIDLLVGNRTITLSVFAARDRAINQGQPTVSLDERVSRGPAR